MTTGQKWSATIPLAVPAAMALLLCLGCNDSQNGATDDAQEVQTVPMYAPSPDSEPAILEDFMAAESDAAEASGDHPVALDLERPAAHSGKVSGLQPMDESKFSGKELSGESATSLNSLGEFTDDHGNGQGLGRGDDKFGAARNGVAGRIMSKDGRADTAGSSRQLQQSESRFQTILNTKAQPSATFELQPGEELWVIAASKPNEQKNTDTAPNPNIPGCGALLARIAEEPKLVPVPLKHTDVTGTIHGYIASVRVKQQFQNPFDSKIEAVYVFPLPQQAAVNEFIMTVGERRIRGIIRERKEAEKIYNRAKAQGHVASLMTQERPNIFMQKVANIEPGKQIDIDIRYFNTLQWDDGAYEFVFPMVIGPRFNPAGSTDPIPAIARATQTVTDKAVAYLAPDERSGHDISLSIDVHAGVSIEHIESVNHVINTEQRGSDHRKVTLTASDSIPNRDFVLRYRVAGDTVKSALMTQKDDHGQYFTMMLYPPAELSSLKRSPMEMVFVLDCSGSMSGQPMAQSKAAVRQALKTLTPRDTFQIIRFSSNASQLGNKPIPAMAENIQRALSWLSGLHGSGGTQMIEGIKTALDFPHDEGRFRLVSFLTDGFIGNEQQILTTLHQKRGAARVFSFGVGQSPNRFLMNRMALVGRGAVTYLSLNDDATDVMNRFAERISHPALTDVAIDWGNMQVEDVYPSRLPDLIVGRPIVITGRYTGEASSVRIGGHAVGEMVDYEVNIAEDQEKHPGIAAVWARHKIADLTNQATRAPELITQVKQSVLQTALNHNLMSPYTAFIAVDSMTMTGGDFGTTVAVPVPVPEGVKYETTVSNDGG